MLSDIVDWMFLPPGLSCLLILFGLITLVAWKKLGYTLLIAGLISLYVFCIPFTSSVLANILEPEKAMLAQDIPYTDAQSIVIIGNGRNLTAKEYGQYDTAKKHYSQTIAIDEATRSRLSYAAYISSLKPLPITVSGGQLQFDGTPRAELMAKELQNRFDIESQIFLETRGTSPYENAVNTHNLLVESNINKIILITHAWQMARTQKSFEYAGMEVIPAPIGFYDQRKASGIKAWLPQDEAMSTNSMFFKELIANWLYDIFLIEDS